MISIFLRIEPFAVGISVVLFFVGGLLRMIYALMFESKEPGGPTLEEKILAGATGLNAPKQTLPPRSSMSAVNYFAPASGIRRDTKELQPTSVVEGTTKLLKEDLDQ
jgi:hypothetical protein